MMSSVIYYSKVLTPWKESLKTLVDSSTHIVDWKLISCLDECPVSAYVLFAEEDLSYLDLRILGARQALILVKEWHFSDSLLWIEKGASNSAPISDFERIASWLIGKLSQRDPTSLPAQLSDLSLQTIIDAVPVPIFYKDELHIYRGCNTAFSQFLGRSVDQILGHSVYDVASKELADTYYAADCQLLIEGGTQVYEGKVKDSEGNLYEIEFNKAIFYKQNGEKGGQVGAMLNITERNQLMRKLDKASRTDPLTQTANRREFDNVVRHEIQKAEQEQSNVSLLILDIDHFKQINDAFGHAGGDAALQFVVHCLQTQLPPTATLFRIGGEEFYVLMSQADLAQAITFAENIRQYLPTESLEILGTSVNITVSIGVIQLEHENNLVQCLKRVDQALYQAKKTGRNKVCSVQTKQAQVS